MHVNVRCEYYKGVGRLSFTKRPCNALKTLFGKSAQSPCFQFLPSGACASMPATETVDHTPAELLRMDTRATLELRSSETRSSDAFLRAHVAVKEQLKNYNKGIVHPRALPGFMQTWDGVTFLCLMFTAIVTPVEVCVIGETNLSYGPHIFLFCLNQSINLFFTCDVILNFYLAYQEPANRGGRWVTERKQIRRHYIRGWFIPGEAPQLPTALCLPLPNARARSEPRVFELDARRLHLDPTVRSRHHHRPRRH